MEAFAQPLILLVGQRLGRRDRDRIAGMHAHRIEILDRADDDAVVIAIPHNLHLEFFPADDGFLEQDLAGRRRLEPAAYDLLEFVAVVCDSAAAAAQGE